MVNNDLELSILAKRWYAPTYLYVLKKCYFVFALLGGITVFTMTISNCSSNHRKDMQKKPLINSLVHNLYNRKSELQRLMIRSSTVWWHSTLFL